MSASDRRLWKARVPLNGEVLLCNNLDLRYASCLDISQSGAFIVADDVPFLFGETLTMIFRSPDLDRPIRLAGKIVRLGAKGDTPGFAVEFIEPATGSFTVVHEYVERASKRQEALDGRGEMAVLGY